MGGTSLVGIGGLVGGGGIAIVDGSTGGTSPVPPGVTPLIMALPSATPAATGPVPAGVTPLGTAHMGEAMVSDHE